MNLAAKKIFVIVPMYNEEATITHLLDSLNHQVPSKKFETIVVDNNSSDRSLKVVQSFAKNSNYPIVALSEITPGAAVTRKTGIDYVLSKNHETDLNDIIFAVTDADTIVPKTWIKDIITAFSSEKTDAISGVYTCRPEIDIKINNRLGIKNYFGEIAWIANAMENTFGQFRLRGPNSAFTAHSYLQAKGFIQRYEPNGTVAPRECFDLVSRMINSGLIIRHFNTQIIASQRRKLRELISGGDDSYFIAGPGRRFLAVRDSEDSMLEMAIKNVPVGRWLDYRQALVFKIIKNGFLLPVLEKRIDPLFLETVLGTLEFEKLKNNLDSSLLDDAAKQIYEYLNRGFVPNIPHLAPHKTKSRIRH